MTTERLTTAKKTSEKLYKAPKSTYKDVATETHNPRTSDDLNSSTPENLKPIVIYARISKKDKTTENQRFGLKQHMRTLPQPVELIEEKGSSWRKPLPLLQGIIKRIRNREIRELHLWTVCRAGRDHLVDVTIWKMCEELNIPMVIVEDELDSRRPDDCTRFYQLSINAEMERKRISKRVRLTFARMREEDPENFPAFGRQEGSMNNNTKEKLDAIIMMYDNHWSIWKISKSTGIAWQTIHRVLKFRNLLREEDV